ncbi:MAG: hypothetical protein ACRDQF_06255, partial [Thermocrispum sp.]
MSTVAKLAGFAVAVAMVLGGGWAIGAAAGPLNRPAPATHAGDEVGGHADARGGHDAAGVPGVPGLP